MYLEFMPITQVISLPGGVAALTFVKGRCMTSRSAITDTLQLVYESVKDMKAYISKASCGSCLEILWKDVYIRETREPNRTVVSNLYYYIDMKTSNC